ncbi:MAG: bL21 family ribosomal protein [Actinobacteria bacterium]|nr:bL21 family ribosomal protein [Actinomycetota bacterium]
MDNLGKTSGDEIVVNGAEMAVVGGKTILDGSLLDSVTSRFTVVDNFKGEKVVVFKYKPKKRYRVKTGHRKLQTQLEVTEISSSGINFDEMAVAEETVRKETVEVVDRTKAAPAKQGKAAAKGAQTAKGKPTARARVKVKPSAEVTPRKTVKKKVEKLKITSQKPGAKKQAGKKK